MDTTTTKSSFLSMTGIDDIQDNKNNISVVTALVQNMSEILTENASLGYTINEDGAV